MLKSCAGVLLLLLMLDTLRVINDKQLAALIAKGIDRYPDNSDKMSGTIDVWWIVRILWICYYPI